MMHQYVFILDLNEDSAVAKDWTNLMQYEESCQQIISEEQWQRYTKILKQSFVRLHMKLWESGALHRMMDRIRATGRES